VARWGGPRDHGTKGALARTKIRVAFACLTASARQNAYACIGYKPHSRTFMDQSAYTYARLGKSTTAYAGLGRYVNQEAIA
jgi:hypothetical protein